LRATVGNGEHAEEHLEDPSFLPIQVRRLI
jgi:hypothetical protein